MPWRVGRLRVADGRGEVRFDVGCMAIPQVASRLKRNRDSNQSQIADSAIRFFGKRRLAP